MRRLLPLLVLGCAPDGAPVGDPGDPVDDTVVVAQPVEADGRFLEPTAHLVRASMALRGIRPTMDELLAVEADPEALPGLVDAYLASPEFGEAVRHMHDVWLLADVDNNYYPMGFPARDALRGRDAWAINESVSEAPARLAEHIVVEDRPYTELVTADYTLADDVVATVWGLPYDDELGGWQVTTYTDGRPLAGVLSDPWMHVRHASTETNRQRARAAHLARALLCVDYMGREVEVSDDADLTAGGRNAIEDNPVCVSCHQTLDPLGAAFAPYRGVITPEFTFRYPIDEYRPNLAADYDTPAYYGQPVSDLYDVRQLIAADTRFHTCTVRRFASVLLGTIPEEIPGELTRHGVDVLLEADFPIRPLLRDLVLSDAFREAVPEDPEVDGMRRVSPWLLARSVEDLTGVVWETEVEANFGFGRVGRVPLLEDVTFGFKTLAGGPDGYDDWEEQHSTGPTTLLVQRRLAEYAAPVIVAADLALPAEARRLLPDTTDPAAALVALHFRLFGERLAADNPELQALLAVHALGDDPQSAWTGVVVALFRSPRFLFY
jgi:hypothetical protein